MKKILFTFTMLCAAFMLSCNGNKTNNEGCNGCDGNKTECTQQHSDCGGECDKECDGNCDDCNNDCEGKCDSSDCDKTDCKKAEECQKSDNCNSAKAEEVVGCVQVDNEIFLNQIADYNNPEWKYLGDKPAIVDFYADWCGPCKKVAPLLDEVAKEYAGKLVVYKVNVDNCPEIATAFKISAIPTMLFIPVEGEPIKTIGGMEMPTLVENIAKIMQ